MWNYLVMVSAYTAMCSGAFMDELQVYELNCLGEDMFSCIDGGCVMMSQYCNGEMDCNDGSDENFCPQHKADAVACNSTHQFMCKDQSRCIPVTWVCNADDDCADGSDEASCDPFLYPEGNETCRGFRCKSNGKCISRYWLCDGVYDCEDQSDEDIYGSCLRSLRNHKGIFYEGDDCLEFIFDLPRTYKCLDSSFCVNITDMCNGINDCRDGSDEGPFCKNWSTMCTNYTCGGNNTRCFPERHGPTCYCTRTVYTEVYSHDTRQCEDMDECMETRPQCSQMCINDHSGYRCSCEDGYASDGLKFLCFAQGPEGKLFYSTNNEIRYYTLKTKTQVTVSVGHKQALGVTYDGKRVYWVETAEGHQSILAAELENFEKTKVVLISLGLEDPGDLAVDFLGQQLYFTDAERGFIAVCFLDGSHCTTLNTRTKNPKFITLDVKNGMMFWADWHDESPVIMQARMDGSEPKVLVSSLTKYATGLAVDAPNGRLYYVDGTIKAVRLDNGKIYSLFLKQLHKPFALSVFENMVYFSDWTSNSIMSVNKVQAGNDKLTYEINLSRPVYGMHIYHPVLFKSDNNPCLANTCSHFCLLTSNSSYTCGCPDGMKLDRETCYHDASFRPQYLVVGGGSKFTLIQHNWLGLPSKSATTLNVGRVQAMAYDNLRDMLYIYDGQRKSVSKLMMSEFSTSQPQVMFYTGVDNIVDMEYDYVSDLLYMLDAGHRSIEVISMKINQRALIYRFGGDEKPLSFCLLPDYGKILVAVAESEESCEVHIDRFSLNGQHREHIVTNNLRGERVRLRYAAHMDVVFVSDEANAIIDIMHPGGTGRENFRSLSTTVSSLAVTDTLVFWTERRTHKLYWADMQETTNVRRYDLSFFPNNTVLHLTTTFPPPEHKNHPCLHENSCTHICVRTSNPEKSPLNLGYTCLCPTGLVLVNNICVRPGACLHNELYCHLSNLCIAKAQKCDGKKDCIYGEDEEGCPIVAPSVSPVKWLDSFFTKTPAPPTPCESTMFLCKSDGSCIDRSLLCNKERDCADNSDEEPAVCNTMTCLDSEFMCTSGNCILKSWQCDGSEDCNDGSDELDCVNKTCSPGLFRCSSGECVDMKTRCDGQQDCLDFSDEDHCVSEVPDEKEDVPECAAHEMQCAHNTSICLPLTARCNKKLECPGGTDELDCDVFRCATRNMFTCAQESTCIRMKLVCDGLKQCSDGSDETPLACQLVKKQSKLYPHPVALYVPMECHNGYMCDNRQCVEWSEVCNGTPDCYDGTDENELCGTSCKNHTCSHSCQPSPRGDVCRCPPGYTGGPNGHTCVDVDECVAEPCAHVCRNTQGTYYCSCHPGYSLRSDRHSCKAVSGNLEVLYVSGNSVRTSQPDKYGTVAFSDPTVAAITDIGVDVRKSLLYVTSSEAGKLIEVNDTRNTVTITNVGQPAKVAVDWITGNVYFVDGTPTTSCIRVCHVPNRRCAKLPIKLPTDTQVTAFTIDPASYRLFYCISRTHEMEAVIWSASMSGRSAGDVATLRNCTGLAVDSFTRRLYAAETGPAAIWLMDFSGHNIKKVYRSDPNLQVPRDLALFENHIYFLEANLFKLSRCLLYGRKQCEPFMYRVFNTFVIRHESVQRNDVANTCLGLVCNNVCVIEVDGPVCVCNDGSFAKNGDCPIGDYAMLPRFNGWSQQDREKATHLTSTLIFFLSLLIVVAVAAVVYYRFFKRRRPNNYMQVVFRNNENGILNMNEVRENDTSVHEFTNPIQLLRNYWQQSFRGGSLTDRDDLVGDVLQSPRPTSDTESILDEKENGRDRLKNMLMFKS